MTLVVMVFVFVFGAVMQLLLPGYAALGQAKFPFLLAGVLYYALNRSATATLLAGFLAGFFQDALSGIPLGYSGICFCAAGWLVNRFQTLVLAESPVTVFFFGGVTSAAVTICLHLLLWQADLVAWPAGRALVKALATGLLGMLCAPVVFFVAGSLDRLVGNVEARESVGELEGRI